MKSRNVMFLTKVWTVVLIIFQAISPLLLVLSYDFATSVKALDLETDNVIEVITEVPIVPTESLIPTPTLEEIPTPTPENLLLPAGRQNLGTTEGVSSIKTTSTINGVCAGDHGKVLTCNANDVSIAQVTSWRLVDPQDGCDYPGDTVSFIATFEINATSQTRYDIGVFFANDGDPNDDGAITGSCTVASLPITPIPPFVDEDSDQCGDIHGNQNLFPEIALNVVCQDEDNDNYLNIPYVASWEQNHQVACSGPQDIIPGTGAKCKSDPEGINIPITVPYGASIEVVKNLIPSDDPGLFNLLVDGVSKKVDATNAGTTGKITVGAGTNWAPGATHTVGETAGTNTTFTDYSSSISCVDRGLQTFNGGTPLTFVGAGPLSVPVDKDDDVVCTITNTRKIGSIEVIKNVVPDNTSTNWNVNITGTSLASDTLIGDDTTGALNLPIGTYNVSESAGLNTNMGDYTSSYVCTLNGQTFSSGQGTTIRGLNIDSSSDNYVCTFTNTKLGSIKVLKDMVGGVGSFDFRGNVNGEIHSDNGWIWTDNVIPGVYTSTESVVAGWDLTNISCDDNNSTGDIQTRTATFNLEAGENITCTFTNSKLPTLTVNKIVINNNGGSKGVNDFALLVGADSVNSGESNTMDIGEYRVGEIEDVEYSRSFSGECDYDGYIILNYGDNKTCTITNDDNLPSLTLQKILTNDDGGTRVASDWLLTATGSSKTFSGYGSVTSDNTLVVGTYALSESGPGGYTAGEWSCQGGVMTDNAHVTISFGDNAVCSITNDDKPASLTLIKTLSSNYGGPTDVTLWTLTAEGPETISGKTGDQSITNALISAGTYTLSEDGPLGYTAGAWNCIGVTNTGSSITLNNGDSAVCTINNDANPGNLIVRKVIYNTYNGNDTYEDFSFSVNSNPSIPFESDGQNDISIAAGTYTIVEDDPTPGYTVTYDNCSNIELANGETETCTITNSEVAPRLTLIKSVVNDNGGNALPDDFQLMAGDYPTSSGTEFTVLSNVAYSITETQIDGYEFVSITGDDKCPAVLGGTITLNEGEDITCTITNDDIAPVLVLEKLVINDNGGTSIPTDWLLTATLNELTLSGQGGFISDNTLLKGTYTLGESGPSGYSAGEWSCDGGVMTDNINIELNLGDTAFCSITNDDIAPKLTVVKNVINDNGGTLGVSDFKLYVDSLEVISGVANEFTANSLINVSEENIFGYEPSVWGGDCDEYGTITLLPGDDKVCTITNDDIPGTIRVLKFNDVDGDGLRNTEEGTQEVPLEGFEMVLFNTDNNIEYASAFTDQFGEAVFDDVYLGNYIFSERLSEEQIEDGWILTSINCYDVEIREDYNLTKLNLSASIGSNSIETVATSMLNGLNFVCEVGNQLPQLVIQKSNNIYPTKILAGSNVKFFIDLFIPESVGDGITPASLSEVQVTDLFSDGFEYIAGTGKINGVPYEPVYHSPGVWNVGSISAGDTVQIEYQTIVSNGQDDGVYKDLSWARGLAGNEETGNNVLALNATRDSYFVGSSVDVYSPQEVPTQQVNILTEQLPRTGSEMMVLIVSISIIGFGLGLMALGVINKFNKGSFFKYALAIVGIPLIMSLAAFMGAITAFAAPATFMIDLETPVNTTSNPEFDLTFVTLDLLGLDEATIVKCYSKTGVEDYELFQTITIDNPAGNTGKCNVNSTVITLDGSYTFKVTSEKAGNTAISDEVTVVIDRSKPATPKSYLKTELTECSYKIDFQAADDARTSKIDVFRSTLTSFNADDTTRILTYDLAPNEIGSYTDTIPGCTAPEYYYVIQAVDDLGNRSDLIGDKVVVVLATTTPINNGNVNGTTSTNGAVAGETTGNTTGATNGDTTGENPDLGNPTIVTDENGNVLGQESEKKEFNYGLFTTILVIGVGVLGGAIYALARKK